MSSNCLCTCSKLCTYRHRLLFPCSCRVSRPYHEMMTKFSKLIFVKKKHLGPVVRRVDNFIQRINSYPADKIGAFLILIGQRANFIHWIGIYPLDNDIHSTNNRALVFSWANSDSCPGINRAKCFRTGPKRYCCSKGAEPYIHIYAVNKEGVSCRKQGVSRTKIAFLFKCSQFCCLLLHLVQKAKFLCSSNVKAILRCLFFLFFGGGREHAQKPKFGDIISLHKALRPVQFLASFISFYCEIQSYLACGEKIIIQASKNSVK